MANRLTVEEAFHILRHRHALLPVGLDGRTRFVRSQEDVREFSPCCRASTGIKPLILPAAWAMMRNRGDRGRRSTGSGGAPILSNTHPQRAAVRATDTPGSLYRHQQSQGPPTA